MSSFDWKKNIEDSVKDGLTITATTTRIFYSLKAQAWSLRRRPEMLWISWGLLVEQLVVSLYTKNGSTSDTTKNLMASIRAIKLHAIKVENKVSALFYRSLGGQTMVEDCLLLL